MSQFLASSSLPAHSGLSDLAGLPEDMAVRLPQGQQLGPADAPVRLLLSRWSSIARLKAGQIGALAEEYVEGKLQFEGAMRDVMCGGQVISDTSIGRLSCRFMLESIG